MSLFEKVTYFVLLIIFAFGIYFDFTDQAFFENNYAREDGLFENATAVMLFAGGVLMLYRFMKLGRGRSGWFKFTTLGIALALLFVAGEEISWGQRIFEVESSGFFLENNVQDETNFHNLVVGGVKLNKLIFGQILTAFILIFLIVIPILYKRWARFKSLVNKFAIPMPKMHHALAYLAGLVLLFLISSGKKWELLELALSFIFFFILWRPANDIYQAKKGIN